MRTCYARGIVQLVFLLLCVGTSHATPVAYTDSAAFLADLPGPATTLDFDSLSAGTTIADGDTVGDITFHYDFGGVQMLVTDVFDTTSSPNFLGTSDSDLFQDGDDFDLSFAPMSGIGMFFITADWMLDDDIVLTAGGISAGLVASDVQQTLPDGSNVFFLGIIDDASTFTTASIQTIGGGFFLYNVDDIVTAVIPEPQSAALFALGFTVVAVTLRHRFTSRSRPE